MGNGCFGSRPGSPSQKEKMYKDKDQCDYSHQEKLFNQQLFQVKEQQLKELLHRSIGALTFLDKYRKLHVGSATLISKDVILTAAHNIFSNQYNCINERFKFYIGADGIVEKYYDIETWRYPKQFQTCKPSIKLQYDYAIMRLKQPIEFDDYVPVSQVCTECLNKNKLTLELKVYGYPAAYGNFVAEDKQGTKIRLHQYGLTRQARIVQIDGQQQKLGYGISTLPGQSGCPVVMNDKIIAVHVGGYQGKYNVGRIVDNNLIERCRKWGEQLGAQQYLIEKEKTCSHKKLVLRSKKVQLKKGQFIGPKYKQVNAGNEKSKNKSESKKFEGYKQLSIKDSIQQDPPQESLFLVQQKKEKPSQSRNSMKNITADHQKPKNLSSKKQIQQQLSSNKINNSETKFDLSSRSLHSVDFSEGVNILELNCNENFLQKIDLSYCHNLIILKLNKNQLQRIDVSKNTNLTHLQLCFNQLQEIDLKTNNNLTRLLLHNNHIQKIDLKTNTKLTYLSLFNNKIGQINLSKNANLSQLPIWHNKLTHIRLYIAEKVGEKQYIYNFHLSDQQATTCLVQLKCKRNVEAVKQKAVIISNKWKQRYSQKQQNKYNCEYNFSIL